MGPEHPRGQGGELRLGAIREPIATTELSDAEKPPILRAYLERWEFEVARFFEGATHDTSLGDLRDIAPGFPVFRIRPAEIVTSDDSV